MRVLFIGGTGNISEACTRDALARGIDVVHLNRGRTGLPSPAVGSRGAGSRVATITADIRKPTEAAAALRGMTFDVVVDWIAFTPEHIRVDLDLFRDRTSQFVFISSASVYHKPVRHHVITEGTPAHNPYWEYSRNKIACEELLRDEYAQRGFPFTIVRPSHTYSDGWFPTTFGSKDFTYPQRIIDGKPIVVHGDGQSLWTITHADDFAKGFNGLLGNPQVIGETFHITSDEAMTWDQIHLAIGAAVGAAPDIVHVSSEIIARFDTKVGPGLVGDKQYSVVFDNSRIKRYVPGYQATIPFAEGMRRSMEWIRANPERKTIDAGITDLVERLVAAMAGLSA